MKYDLLAIDLDGTLLRRDATVSPVNIAAVRLARDAGLEIVIATGRALVESSHILAAIGHDGAFIGAGGAITMYAATGRVLERTLLDEAHVRTITHALNSHGHAAHLLKDREIAGYDYTIVGTAPLDPATEWWFRNLPVDVRFAPTFEDDAHPHATLRCGTVATARQLAQVATELREALGDAVLLQHWPAVTESAILGTQTHLLEVFTPGVDKWTALERHANRRNVPIERVAAVGDGLNDIRMIQDAGLGIAMGNADPAVMHVAKHVAPDNEHDGLAEAIRRMVSGDW